ncbi:MAG: hypothetical protein ACRDD2_04950 [Sarcina sp.]
MGLRDYRGYENLQPQRREAEREFDPKEKRLYLKKIARLKKKKDQSFKNSVLMVAVLTCVLGGIIIKRDSNIYNMQSNIKKMESEAKLIGEQNEDLRIKLLQNSSLEKIEKIAREKLKMIDPQKEDIMDVKNPSDAN